MAWSWAFPKHRSVLKGDIPVALRPQPLRPKAGDATPPRGSRAQRDEDMSDPDPQAGFGRVLVADPQPLTRLGMRRALEEQGFVVCAEVADGADALKAALRERPDACLIDLRLPDDATSAVRAIASALPDTAVLIVASTGEEHALLEAFCAGASGHVPRDADAHRLMVAVRAALEGEVSLPRGLLASLVEELRKNRENHRASGNELTARERDVVALLRRGFTTAEIARRLFVEQVTVRSHVCSILHKLGVPNREAALRLLDESENR
jgi:two-component system, NarL family, nitrate/nitrite response regulator NarL